MTVKEEIESLRSQLHHHNYLYYVENTPDISDFEFDSLMKRLQILEKRGRILTCGILNSLFMNSFHGPETKRR